LIEEVTMWFSSNTPDDELRAALAEVDANRAILLDVREQKEWDEKRLAQATHVPTTSIKELPETATEIPGVSKAKRVYIHCAKGARAKQMAQRMESMGYDAVPLVCAFDQLPKIGFRQG
jgi:rhodanese-related sulfurtransferase